MQYLLLIYGNETCWNKLSEAEQGKVSQEYGEFTQSIAGSGHLKGGNELDRISTATTVRMRTAWRLLPGRSEGSGRSYRTRGPDSVFALGLD